MPKHKLRRSPVIDKIQFGRDMRAAMDTPRDMTANEKMKSRITLARTGLEKMTPVEVEPVKKP